VAGWLCWVMTHCAVVCCVCCACAATGYWWVPAGVVQGAGVCWAFHFAALSCCAGLELHVLCPSLMLLFASPMPSCTPPKVTALTQPSFGSHPFDPLSQKKHDKMLPHTPCRQFYIAHLHNQPWVQVCV
jgi:hypothetical protein